MKPRLPVLIVSLVIVLLAVIGLVSVAFPALKQPIAFNHRLHTQDVGAECTDCHLYANTGHRATIPNIEICGLCHEENSTGSAEETKLLEHVQSEHPIPWRKVYRLPDHVYFSHRMHTAIGGVDCEVCHGTIAAREIPLTEQLVPVTMESCMQCHEQNGVSNDCIACHT